MVTTGQTPLTQRPAWRALDAHYRQIRDLHLRQLFAEDPQRGERLTAEGAGLYLDYSKHRVIDETLRHLLQLEAAEAFDKSWDELLATIDERSAALAA